MEHHVGAGLPDCGLQGSWRLS